MKRQLITYILAAFCAVAVMSCNKEAAFDKVGPDSELTVLLTASIDASTKAVSIDKNEVVCSWAIGEKVDLVYRDTVITQLSVVSIDGDKAQLSGKVLGAYRVDDEMKLFYGGTDYDYSGQTGTESSAVSKAFLQADTKVLSLVGKTLTLESATLEHQQAYMGLVFYYEDKPTNVKSVAIKEGGKNIIKTRSPLVHTDSLATYGTEEFFTVTSEEAYGQQAFYFALSDTTTTSIENHKYKLEITTIIQRDDPLEDTTIIYTGEVAVPGLRGNYFADSRVNLVRRSPVITAPTVYSHIYYDGLPHNLLIPAVVRPGTVAEYAVSSILNVVPTETEWSTAVPKRTEEGYYTVWYRVKGGNDYESILPTMVGTTIIQGMYTTSIKLPTAIDNLIYSANPQTLLDNDGRLKVNDVVKDEEKLEYYVDSVLYNGNNASLPETTPTPPTGEETTGWSENIPKGTNAGMYYIWCRYKGDISKGYMPAMDGPVTVTIAQKPVTFKADNQIVSYGNPIDVDLSHNVVLITSGNLVSGHVLHSVEFNPAGDVAIYANGTISLSNACIYYGSSVDVTNNYNISFDENKGTITVTNTPSP